MVSTTQAVPSALVSKEYNDVYSAYYDRPTFVSIETMRDGSKVLTVTVNAYGSRTPTTRFFERDIPKYVAAIDKYLAWESKAREKGDVIQKEISVVPAPNLINISFDFVSANQASHFLSIGVTDSGLLGKTTIPFMVLDRQNAFVLRKLISDLPAMSSRVKADDYK